MAKAKKKDSDVNRIYSVNHYVQQSTMSEALKSGFVSENRGKARSLEDWKIVEQEFLTRRV
jgi:hypothetical protein